MLQRAATKVRVFHSKFCKRGVSNQTSFELRRKDRALCHEKVNAFDFRMLEAGRNRCSVYLDRTHRAPDESGIDQSGIPRVGPDEGAGFKRYPFEVLSGKVLDRFLRS